MFDFFLKKKKIVLDCFTYRQYIYDIAKIAHGSKYFPEWWLKTPNTNISDKNVEFLTIKNCDAIIQFYKNGIVIPSWFSLNLNIGTEIENRIEWETTSDNFKNIPHGKKQFSLFALENGFNFKIQSDWHFSCKKNIKFVWTQPVWSNRTNLFKYHCLPGVMQFKTQHATNINFICQYDKEPKTISIDFLDPLVILHPMTEYDIEVKNHLVSKEEWEQKNISNFFVGFPRNVKELVTFKDKKRRFIKKMEELNGK